VARRAIVLLSNDQILPLVPAPRRIALIGPLADARSEMLGPWAAAGDAGEAVTLREGLARALPEAEIGFAPGVGIEDDDVSGIAPALAICRGADVIVLCLGEAAAMSGEAASRAKPILPGRQEMLARAALAQGKPVVAILFSGRPLTIPWLAEKAAAVVAAWLLGVEAGNALADVLAGEFNPTGRLPVSWPRDVGQVPVFFAARPSGRAAAPGVRYSSQYLDLPAEPQFAFGHGLSYGRFAVTNLRANRETFRLGDEIGLAVDVVNEGACAGEETLFLFARDVVASVARPLLELKGVGKIALGAGESGTVHFCLSADALRFPGVDFRARLEPGDFQLSVGASADPHRLLTIGLRALED
jgi:beta-glucosidase